jgi:phosphoribosylanthranilate isomerase
VDAPYAVKVCGITRAADATAALRQGVAFIGINRWPSSPRFVPEARLPSLLDVIPAGRRVCVDVQPLPAALENARDAGFDCFQIHFDPVPPDAPEALAAWARILGRHRLWLAPRVAPADPWPWWVLDYADTFLCDGFHAGQFGGTGRVADWARFSALKRAHPQKRWLLAGGLGAGTIEEAALTTGADFFDLNSGIEDAPGMKNSEKLARVLALLHKIKQAPVLAEKF